MILLKNNKLLKNKEGKVIISHNIPFTPVCEKYITYDSITHSFIRSEKQYSWQWFQLGFFADFRIPIMFNGDFEFSFTMQKYIQYLTVMVCTDYDSKNTKLRGFNFHDGVVYALVNFCNITEIKEEWYYFIDPRDKRTYEQFKIFKFDSFINSRFAFKRKNGIITFYFNDKIFHTYKDKFEYPVEILGCMRSKLSRIDHFSLKQL